MQNHYLMQQATATLRPEILATALATPVLIGAELRGGAPTLASILTKAGAQSAYFDLRNSATIFQDIAGTTTPVTASSQPLGCVMDTLNGHRLAAADIDTRAEYWIDPFTSEPVTWYDLTDDLLLWPTIEGAIGTFCVAYSTGAQVFDLAAGPHIPPGPMIAAYFFDFVLSDAEAEVMKAHMDTIVGDDSWMGYVRDTTYVDAICPVTAGVQVHFTVDATHDCSEWTSEDVPGAEFVALSEARQRFKITVADPSEFNIANANPLVGEYYVLDVLGNTLWFPEIDGMLTPLINGWHISVGAYASADVARYGAVNVLQRAPTVPAAQVGFSASPFGGSPYMLHAQPIGRVWTAASPLIRFVIFESAGYRIFSDGPGPNLSAATVLKEFRLQGQNITGLLPPIPSPLVSYDVAGYIDNQPAPAIAANPSLTYLAVDGIPITTLVDISELSAVSVFTWSDTALVNKAMPSLTALTTGIDPAAANNIRIFFERCGLTSYAGGVIAPGSTPDQYQAGGVQVRFNNNALDQVSVDAVLKACLDMGYDRNGGATCRCYVHQGTNATPSALGLTYKTALEALGWTVAINP